MSTTGTCEQVCCNCSFCTKPSTAVSKLIAGPGVYICNECVGLCCDILQQEAGAQSRPQLKPWEGEHTLEEVLAILPQVGAASAQLETAFGEWVRTARTLGATWARIGEALHMTRQSAWERFSGEE